MHEDASKLVEQAYTKVEHDGLQRCDLENDWYIVKAYRAGSIIRIDIKEK